MDKRERDLAQAMAEVKAETKRINKENRLVRETGRLPKSTAKERKEAGRRLDELTTRLLECSLALNDDKEQEGQRISMIGRNCKP